MSVEKAIENAGKFIVKGADAVKIEGGSEYIISLTKSLTQSGIPVLAHLGFTPQYINTIGAIISKEKILILR